MKRTIMTATAMTLLAGCQYLPENWWTHIPEPAPVVTNTPPADPVPVTWEVLPVDYANPAHLQHGLLWKPIADGGGPAVVLLPRQMYGHVTAFVLAGHHPVSMQWMMLDSGEPAEIPYEDGRTALRLHQQGAWYGTHGECHLQVGTTDGPLVTYRILRPSERMENGAIPVEVGE